MVRLTSRCCALLPIDFITWHRSGGPSSRNEAASTSQRRHVRNALLQFRRSRDTHPASRFAQLLRRQHWPDFQLYPCISELTSTNSGMSLKNSDIVPACTSTCSRAVRYKYLQCLFGRAMKWSCLWVELDVTRQERPKPRRWSDASQAVGHTSIQSRHIVCIALAPLACPSWRSPGSEMNGHEVSI